MNFAEGYCKYDIKKFIKTICEEYKIDYWDEWLENQAYDLLQKRPNYLVSADDEKGLVGLCAVKHINSKECYLNTFYVRKDYRNKQVGTNLFEMCMNHIIKNGYSKILVCIDPNFEIAKNMYEKRGFIFDYYDEEARELWYYKYIE